MKRIKLVKPNKELYLSNIEHINSESDYEKLRWLAESDFDIVFYRDEGDRIIELTKEQMLIAIEENWEMRG